MPRQAVRIANAERIDLRPVARRVDERIVLGNRPVVIEPQQLAEVVRRILCVVGHADLVAPRHAEHHVDLPVRSEGDARGLRETRVVSVRHEEIPHLHERAAPVELAARQDVGGGQPVPGTRLVVGEVDELVLLVAGMERDVHQTRAAVRKDLRDAGERLGIQHAVADDPETAAVLRDEHVAVRQERERPGTDQALHGHHPERLLLRVEHPRRVGQRGRRRAVAAVGSRLGLLGGSGRGQRRGDGERSNPAGIHGRSTGTTEPVPPPVRSSTARRRPRPSGRR